MLGFIFMLIAFAARANAADAPTAITGIAVDPQGLALPGVTVTLMPAGGPAADTRVQVTDSEGRFTFVELTPGTYTVVVSLSGFEDKKFDAVTVPTKGGAQSHPAARRLYRDGRRSAGIARHSDSECAGR